MSTDSTNTMQRLTPEELIHVVQLFQVTLDEIKDGSVNDGSILITDIPVNGVLESLLTRDWLDGRVGDWMNEATLVWLDPNDGWTAYRVGPVMEASRRFQNLCRMDRASEGISLGTKVDKNIYFFFQSRDRQPRLYLGHPGTAAFFNDDGSFWPVDKYASYLKALRSSVGPTSPVGGVDDSAVQVSSFVASVHPAEELMPVQTRTSDLLFRMYEIACCNDPKQEILPRVAAHLKEFGYDLSEC